MEHARRASESDESEVLRLLARMRTEVASQRGGDLWLLTGGLHGSPDREWFARALQEKALFVGLIDDAVVGYAYSKLQELPDGSVIGVIRELYVEPEARGVSVGEAMMLNVLEWARASNCSAIDATVLPGDRGTKNFFERFGLSARSITVTRTLGEGG